MRCIVTGGAGFIGSHVVDALKSAGHEVTVLDHRVRPHRADVGYKDVDVIDYSSVYNACAGADVIYHLAAVSNVNYAFEQPVYTVKLNIEATANILEAARHLKVKRVVFASTVWVYTGARISECDEDSPFYMPGAGHVYTSTKIASELLCHDYATLYGQEFTILRYGIPYGPRMRDELLVPIFLKKALAGQPLTIAGDGAQYRNFIYVEDLARAHVLCLGEKGKNQIFNLEGMRRISVKEVAETIQRLVGDVKIVYTPARPGDYAGKEVSNARAERTLGWKPTVDFGEGMKRTLAWYRSRPVSA